MSDIEFKISWEYFPSSKSLDITYEPTLPPDLKWLEEWIQLRRFTENESDQEEEIKSALEIIYNEILSIVSKRHSDEFHMGVSISFTCISYGNLFSELNEVRCQYKLISKYGEKILTTTIPIKSLSKASQNYIYQVLQYAKKISYQNIMDHLSKEKIVNKKQYKKSQEKVFLSCRGRMRGYTKRIHKSLKEYAHGSFFKPFLDIIDLKPGIWLKQLEKSLKEADRFLPILTKDYFAGPISQAEYDLALRQYYETRKISIVPIVAEGNFDDYKNSFIGGFTMIKIYPNLNNEKYKNKIDDLVLLLLKEPS